MKAVVVIANLAWGIPMLICLCLMLMGLGYLVSGRSPHGPAVHGKGSRKIGLAYLGQGIGAFAIHWALFEAFGWGTTPRSADELLAQALGQGVAGLLVFGSAVFFANRWAREFAKGQAAMTELDAALEGSDADPPQVQGPAGDPVES